MKTISQASYERGLKEGKESSSQSGTQNTIVSKEQVTEEVFYS